MVSAPPTGDVPDSVEAMADDAYAFIRGLGFDTIDVFAFSLGGMVAQGARGKHPELVTASSSSPGTGPAGGKDIDKVAGTVLRHPGRHADAVRPEGVPLLQPQRHRQAGALRLP